MKINYTRKQNWCYQSNFRVPWRSVKCGSILVTLRTNCTITFPCCCGQQTALANTLPALISSTNLLLSAHSPQDWRGKAQAAHFWATKMTLFPCLALSSVKNWAKWADLRLSQGNFPKAAASALVCYLWLETHSNTILQMLVLFWLKAKNSCSIALDFYNLKARAARHVLSQRLVIFFLAKSKFLSFQPLLNLFDIWTLCSIWLFWY